MASLKSSLLNVQHAPEAAKLDMDRHGWVSVAQLIQNVNATGKAYLTRELLPEHPRGQSLRKNGTICDVEKALELVAQELKEKYGIDVQPEKAEASELDELTGNQLSFFLILPPLALQNTA